MDQTSSATSNVTKSMDSQYSTDDADLEGASVVEEEASKEEGDQKTDETPTLDSEHYVDAINVLSDLGCEASINNTDNMSDVLEDGVNNDHQAYNYANYAISETSTFGTASTTDSMTSWAPTFTALDVPIITEGPFTPQDSEVDERSNLDTRKFRPDEGKSEEKLASFS